MKEYLETLKYESRLRCIPDDRMSDELDLLSNDYMALAADQDKYIESFQNLISERHPQLSSSASRLLSRRQYWPLLFEKELEEAYGRPALLFNSGYHANVGIIDALSSLPSSLFLTDKLIHASAIDGIRLGKPEYRRFPHNDVAKLKAILEEKHQHYEHIIIVIESVYSMDGDMAPLKEIVKLKHEYPNVMILLDEAHGYGVFGDTGLGLCEELNLIDEIDFIMCTLGKAGASAGAFIISSADWKSFFINTARSFIFSTALPPFDHAWGLAMFSQLRTMNAERKKLAELSDWFRKEVEKITGRPNPSRSQIIPIITGSAQSAVDLAQMLRDNDFDVLPIRKPTVPPGSERIRISLNCNLSKDSLLPILNLLSHFFDSRK